MWYESNEAFTTEGTVEHRGDLLLLPIVTIDHSLNALAKVKDVEVDQQTDGSCR